MLAMATPLGEMAMLNNTASFVLVYLGASILGGLLALYFSQVFIVLTTSVGGAFAFFLALDSFLQTNFNILAIAIAERFKETVRIASASGAPGLQNVDIAIGGYLMFSFWILMSIVGIMFQYKFLGIPGTGSNAAPGQRDPESLVVVVENSRRKKKSTKKVRCRLFCSF